MTNTQLSSKIECMDYIERKQESEIRGALARGKSVLLLGARQTGKTTLLNRVRADLTISFLRPDVRQLYEESPAMLVREIDEFRKETKSRPPLVLLDEIQKVPMIMDVVQDLIDRKLAVFVLTGSSARKLRRGHDVNLLPGRVIALRLDPFILDEYPCDELSECLLFGSLPGIVAVTGAVDRDKDLQSYVTTYLEQEVRSEAIVRNLGSFTRFLQYAASESGQLVNFRKLSQEIGVAHTTVAAHYEILEDCLIAERIEPLTQSKTRKKLTKSCKYLFFDLGVRRAAAREGMNPSRQDLGRLFEQWVGLELVRCARLADKRAQVLFWRDPDGPEVDWVIDTNDQYVPIEVKWTYKPQSSDIRHIELFLTEYSKGKAGYLVCRIPRRQKLSERITAIPWQEVDSLIL